MTADTMPEPEGPQDDRFVYVVTAAGVAALRQSAAAFDREREAPRTAASDGGGAANSGRRRPGREAGSGW